MGKGPWSIWGLETGEPRVTKLLPKVGGKEAGKPTFVSIPAHFPPILGNNFVTRNAPFSSPHMLKSPPRTPTSHASFLNVFKGLPAHFQSTLDAYSPKSFNLQTTLKRRRAVHTLPQDHQFMTLFMMAAIPPQPQEHPAQVRVGGRGVSL